jgi:DNA-binding NarL/FixJ family response regulator
MEVLANVSVFLLAENRLLREALTRILNKKSNISVAGAASYSPDIENVIASVAPEVLLFDPLDWNLSLTLIRHLRDSMPALRIIMIGMEADGELFLRAVREGIAGYLLKDAPAAEVAAAVRSVAGSHAVCPQELCQVLFDYVSRQRAHLPNLVIKQQLGLTRREQQLVELISRGLTNKEIAVELNLSEQTVKNHIHRVLRKVGVSDRLEAVEMCRTQGFLPV